MTEGRAPARYDPRMTDDTKNDAEQAEEVPNPVVLVDNDLGPAHTQTAPEPGAGGIYGLHPEPLDGEDEKPKAKRGRTRDED